MNSVCHHYSAVNSFFTASCILFVLFVAIIINVSARKIHSSVIFLQKYARVSRVCAFIWQIQVFLI